MWADTALPDARWCAFPLSVAPNITANIVILQHESISQLNSVLYNSSPNADSRMIITRDLIASTFITLWDCVFNHVR